MRRLGQLARALAAALWLLGCVAPARPSSPAAPAATPKGPADGLATAWPSVPAPDVALWRLPSRDDLAFAADLGIVSATPPEFDPWLTTEQPGDRTSFWIADVDTGTMREVKVECVALGQHLGVWIEDGWEIAPEAVAAAIDTWDTVIYPTMRQVLGGSALPADGRVAVVHAGFSGASAYVSRASLLPTSVYAHSNQRAMIAVNLHHVQPGTGPYLGVLAHELRHLAHLVQDPSEDAWFNEGVSTLAEDVTGLATVQRGSQLLAQPDHPLLIWHDDPAVGARDYDSSYLFLRYLADRFGLQSVAEIDQDDDHAPASIDRLLAAEGGMDGIFADWLVANLLDDPATAGGRYGYHSRLGATVAPVPLTSPPAAVADTVANYGGDYWELDLTQGDGIQIRFEGDAAISIGPEQSPSGERVWWSRRGDGVHTWLQLYVDLRGMATATLAYQLWHDLEPGWDYAYLRVSQDAGQTWHLLGTDATSTHDPLGYAYGPAYTGRSGCDATGDAACQSRWLAESVALDAYAGAELLVRWDYMTDEAVHGAGLFLDEVAVSGETADGRAIQVTAKEAMDPHTDAPIRMDWSADGFTHTPVEIAQSWRLIVVEQTDRTRVQHLPVGRDGSAVWSLEEAPSDGRFVIVVAATNRHTATRPSYRLIVEQLADPSG